jgi:phosphoribosyl 1,2-cyclic phosphodiesterase
MNVRVLGSSSAGNSTVVWDEGAAILIDCGFRPSYIRRHLEKLRLSLSTISGALLTHLHNDHLHEETIQELVQNRIPIFLPPKLRVTAKKTFTTIRMADAHGLLQTLEEPHTEIGPFSVGAFEVFHDAPGGCYGYVIRREPPGGGSMKAVMATDVGFTSRPMVEAFADADLMIIESNHDPEMLENSGRPDWLKRRIRERGHLSNEECARFLVEVLNTSDGLPEAIILAHVSQECNTIDRAIERTTSALAENGYSGIRVLPTFRGKPNDIVKIGAPQGEQMNLFAKL